MDGIFTPLVTNDYILKFNVGDLTEGQDSYPIKTTASGNPITGLAFSSSVVESMYDSFQIPTGWLEGTDIVVKVHFFNGSGQTGVACCCWALDYQTYDELDNIADKPTTTVMTTKYLPEDANADTYITAPFSVSCDNSDNPIAKSKFVTFKIYRDCACEDDSMEDDAVLVLLTFQFIMEVS